MRTISFILMLALSLGVKAQLTTLPNDLDSGEVIGSFMYLFQNNDTIIIDLSSIAVESDSIWTIQNDTLKPILTQNFVKIVTDSTFEIINNNNPFYLFNGSQPNFKDIGIDLPISGSYNVDSTDGYINMDGAADFSEFSGQPRRFEYGSWSFGYLAETIAASFVFQNTATVSVRDSDFFRHGLDVDSFSVGLKSSNLDAGYQNSIILDTTKIAVTYRSENFGGYNENGFILPRLSSEPTGESGSIYYNSSNTEFRAYNGSGFQTISTYGEGAVSPIGSLTPDHAGIIYYQTSNSHLFISVGTTSSDWIKIN